MTASRETPPREGTAEGSPSQRGETGPNVGRWERIASVVAGGTLLVRGLRRGSVGGAVTALAGGALCYRGVTGSSRLYRALGIDTTDLGARERAERATVGERPGVHEGPSVEGEPAVERTVTVGAEPEDLAAYWHDPDRLTRIVGRFADVSGVDGDDRHRWRVEAPLGRTLEWETELVAERPGECLRWESREGAPLPHDWTVSFEPAPGDRGTHVSLRIRFDPPGGPLGAAALSRLGFGLEPLAGRALGRFKSLVETGEIPTTEATPSARGNGDVV